MEKNKISIVVPCFNEKEALPLFYNKITSGAESDESSE